MSEGGRAVDQDEVDSPWPAGYGRLDAVPGATGIDNPGPPAPAAPTPLPPAPAPVPSAPAASPGPPPPSGAGPPGPAGSAGFGSPEAPPAYPDSPAGATGRSGQRVSVTAPVTPVPAPPRARSVPMPAPRPTGVPLPPGVPSGPAGPAGPTGRGYDPDATIVEGPVKGRIRPRRNVKVVRGVRSRRLVRRIDVLTVFKVSVAFYLLALLTLVVAGVVVWNVAQAFGLITSIEKSVRTLFSLKTFTLHAATTLEYGVAIGAVLCLFGALFNTLVAAVYNLISDVIGGVQVVVVTEAD